MGKVSFYWISFLFLGLLLDYELHTNHMFTYLSSSMLKGCSPFMVFQNVLSSFSLLTISDSFTSFQTFVALDYDFSFYTLWSPSKGETLGSQEEQSDKQLTKSFNFTRARVLERSKLQNTHTASIKLGPTKIHFSLEEPKMSAWIVPGFLIANLAMFYPNSPCMSVRCQN